MRINILRHLAMRSEGNDPKSWDPTIILHNNAPPHRSVLVNDWLAQNNITTLEHPQYSRDLVPADFHPFPRLK